MFGTHIFWFGTTYYCSSSIPKYIFDFQSNSDSYSSIGTAHSNSHSPMLSYYVTPLSTQPFYTQTPWMLITSFSPALCEGIHTDIQYEYTKWKHVLCSYRHIAASEHQRMTGRASLRPKMLPLAKVAWVVRFSFSARRFVSPQHLLGAYSQRAPRPDTETQTQRECVHTKINTFTLAFVACCVLDAGLYTLQHCIIWASVVEKWQR